MLTTHAINNKSYYSLNEIAEKIATQAYEAFEMHPYQNTLHEHIEQSKEVGTLLDFELAVSVIVRICTCGDREAAEKTLKWLYETKNKKYDLDCMFN